MNPSYPNSQEILENFGFTYIGNSLYQKKTKGGLTETVHASEILQKLTHFIIDLTLSPLLTNHPISQLNCVATDNCQSSPETYLALTSCNTNLNQGLARLINILPDDPNSYEDTAAWRSIQDEINRAKKLVAETTPKPAHT